MNLTRSLLPFTFALIALFALAACGPAATQAAMPAAAAPLTLACPEQSQAFVTALDQHVTTWGQAADSLLDGQDFQSAIPVLRQSSQDLPALIERLRGIQEEVRRMDAPACAEPVRGAALGRWTARSRYFTTLKPVRVRSRCSRATSWPSRRRTTSARCSPGKAAEALAADLRAASRPRSLLALPPDIT